jgi:hypothetical protein
MVVRSFVMDVRVIVKSHYLYRSPLNLVDVLQATRHRPAIQWHQPPSPVQMPKDSADSLLLAILLNNRQAILQLLLQDILLRAILPPQIRATHLKVTLPLLQAILLKATLPPLAIPLQPLPDTQDILNNHKLAILNNKPWQHLGAMANLKWLILLKAVLAHPWRMEEGTRMARLLRVTGRSRPRRAREGRSRSSSASTTCARSGLCAVSNTIRADADLFYLFLYFFYSLW